MKKLMLGLAPTILASMLLAGCFGAKKETAQSVAEAYNAAMAEDGYSFEMEYDEDYDEWWIALSFGAPEDGSEEEMASAAYALAAYLPEVMGDPTEEVYGDPTDPDYVPVFSSLPDTPYYFMRYTSKNETVKGVCVSYITQDLLVCQVEVWDVKAE